MHLISAKVGPFKSIETSNDVKVEEGITVLVGMNEAGKTVFLQALQKTDDVFGRAQFEYVDDYPRRHLNSYDRRHGESPDTVAVLTYRLDSSEVAEINRELHTKLPDKFQLSINDNYKNETSVYLAVDHRPVIAEIAWQPDLSVEFRNAIAAAPSFELIPRMVEGLSITDADKKCLASINQRIEKAAKANWKDDTIGFEVWQRLRLRTPKFMYFGDYEVLPSKMNLADLATRVEEEKTKPGALTPEHRGIQALLRMANISIGAFAAPGALDSLISRIESVSISLTIQIMEFWKQNEDLQVKIDIRPDPNDQPPFNNGPNLYIRIANNKQHGISTPFKQRSRGFIWFFSFLVWFDSVQHQLGDEKETRPLILLLDEPGLALHALAQYDFLRYIDNLGKKHQVIYSTHSPFMLHSDRLHEVRIVEDRESIGTVICDNASWTDERTMFPLQAALGWTVAQNLFVSEQNLLVEESADLVYLQVASAILEAKRKTGLRDDITIVPVGGLDKVVAFMALLGANKLKLAVFRNRRGAPEQKLLDLLRDRSISSEAVLDASRFCDRANLGMSKKPADVEDLFEPAVYLHYFNKAFEKQLAGTAVKETDLPSGDRIAERLERHIAEKRIQLRAGGGFNRYTPATAFARDPSAADEKTLSRFEALFKAVNLLF